MREKVGVYSEKYIFDDLGGERGKKREKDREKQREREKETEANREKGERREGERRGRGGREEREERERRGRGGELLEGRIHSIFKSKVPKLWNLLIAHGLTKREFLACYF